MSGIAAIHAHMQLQHAAACRRRRVDVWDGTFGNAYLTSDGSAGSYAAAATTAPALLFLPGGSALGTASFVAWVRDAALTGQYMTASAATSGTRNYARVTSTGLSFMARSDNNVVVATATQGSFAPADWTLIVATMTHGASDVLGISHGGAAQTTATDASPDTFLAGNHFRLFSHQDASSLASADLRSPGVFSRVITDAEIAALHTLGPTHDLRVASGDYLGDVAHWWPADGDTGTTVTDRGVVGGCDLVLNGAVTIAEVA